MFYRQAGIQLFRYPLGREETECLYHFGESQFAACRPAPELPGLQYFQSFLPVVQVPGKDMIAVRLVGESHCTTCLSLLPCSLGVKPEASCWL